jgi:uncharacterized protein YjcR
MRRKLFFPNVPPNARITEEDCLLTSRDVAEMLAVDPQTVRGWRSRNKRAGEGPEFIKLGSGPGARVRYRRSAVEKYLRNGAVRAKKHK